MCARARLLDEEAAAAALVITERQLDPTRVRLLYALVEAGELCVCDLAAVVGAPETSVSAEHLRHSGLS